MNADKRGWTQWSPQDFSAGQTGLVILQVGQILREPGFRKFHRLGKSEFWRVTQSLIPRCSCESFGQANVGAQATSHRMEASWLDVQVSIAFAFYSLLSLAKFPEE